MAGTEPRPPDGDAAASAWIEGALAGDAESWRRLVEEYGPRVFALAKSRLRDPDAAEELTQSVMATIAVKLGQGAYVEHGRFESWLFRIAMNRIRDSVRRARREADPLRFRLAATAEDCEPEAPIDPAFAPLRAALEGLTGQDREIIELRYHGGMGFRQMSELLGEPLGTLLARHHRALRKLRRVMDEQTGDEQESSPNQAGGGLPHAAGGTE